MDKNLKKGYIAFKVQRLKKLKNIQKYLMSD